MSRRTLSIVNDRRRSSSLSTSSIGNNAQKLQARFNMLLLERQALEVGLCPERRRLYDELFDELIRMTKLDCLERGELLERIKNEQQQWMKTYDELYASMMAYGMRQYIHRMEEKKNLEDAAIELENDCRYLCDALNKESIRLEQLRERVHQTKKFDDEKIISLRNAVVILRATKEKLHSELETTLTTLLSSSIFLNQPVDLETATLQ
jgi:dynein light intermediate chain, axonemal